MLRFFASSLLLLLTLPIFAADVPTAERLRTEFLENPLGVDTPAPKVSWQFMQRERGARQTAYNVQVAESAAALAAGKALLWDSGKVRSAETANIPLTGIAFAGGTTYFWRVRVWDARDVAGPYSAPATFEMGLLHAQEWQGAWLSPPFVSNGYQSNWAVSADSVKWLQVKLGGAQISAIKLFPARPYNFSEDTPGFGFPLRYRVEVDGKVVADHTDADQPNPGAGPVTIAFPAMSAKTVRLTATRLYGPRDGRYVLAMARVEVYNAQGVNVALHAPADVSDSYTFTEDDGWYIGALTEEHTTAAHAAPAGDSPLFRHEFTLDKPVKRARAYLAALGYGELYVNGEKVGDHVLDPAYTYYEKRVLYSSYDITARVHPGRNAVGAMLGKGNLWWVGSPAVLVQVNIEFTDGTRSSVVSGPEWKRGWGPVLENSVFNGETYDARQEQPGWASPGFAEAGWEPAQVIPAPTQTLSAEMMPPIRVMETLPAKRVTSPRPGVWVFDFGQDFAGWCQLHVSGPAGTRIVLRHAELLHPDGTINDYNLRMARCTDVYVLKGQGEEIYEPRFTYRGFRYVQVEGYPGQPALTALRGRVVHTGFTRHGSFSCSNPLFNQIQTNACWSYQSNYFSIPTDCPQRGERQGWLDASYQTLETGLYNYDSLTAYPQFLQDIADSQLASGNVIEKAPCKLPYSDPAWSAGYHYVTWDLYRFTGNTALLAEHYAGLKAYADFLAREANNGVITRGGYGDWVCLSGTPIDFLSTASYYRVCDTTARAARRLGHAEEAAVYEARRAQVAQVLNTKFFDANTNNYGNGSQTSNAIPLWLGIVPQDKRQAVLDNLVHDILVTHHGHLSTGFVGTYYLLDTLTRQGRPDVAYTIATQPDYPGWAYMIANGATTMWEDWQEIGNNETNSWNHPDLGLISAWFYRTLAGIVPDDDYPGFARFTIKPHLLGDLKEVTASTDTIRGPITSHWQRDAQGVTLQVSIPPNTSADIWVPKAGKAVERVEEGTRTVWQHGKYLPGAAGITGGADADEWVKFTVGGGSYSFRVD